MKYTSKKWMRLMDELKQLVAQGKTAKECAKILGITTDRIYHMLPGGSFQHTAWRTKIRNRNLGLRAHILKGLPPKSYAIENGVSPQTISRMLDRVGVRKYFLTKEEYAHIVQRRKQGVAA